MSTKGSRELIRQTIQEWNTVNGDVAKIRSLFDKYYAPDFIYHDVSTGDTNRQQTIEDMVGYLSAFPDAQYSIDDIVAEGNKTAIRCTLRATHQGTFKGIPATGKQIVVKQVELHQIARGRIVEAWGFSDSLSMMSQLGINPDTAAKE